MSGGALNYFYNHLEEHADDLGDRELNDLVKDLAQLYHDREWCLSGDICDGKWNEARDDFKKKWLTPEGREHRMKEYLDECIEEMRYLVDPDSRKYCNGCIHWKRKSPRDRRLPADYGKCDFESSCLVHGHEDKCRKYEART